MTGTVGDERVARRCNSWVAIGGIADIRMRWSRKARLRMTQCRPESAFVLRANSTIIRHVILNVGRAIL
jgi:hypothetical protein